MKMKKNVGSTDKAVRVVLALIFVILGYLYSPWLYIVAVILLATALVGMCGLYAVFGINTCKVKK